MKKKKKLRKNELVIRANKHTHTHTLRKSIIPKIARHTAIFQTFSFSLATDSDKWGGARAQTRGREQSRNETITNKNRDRRLNPSSHRLKLKSLALTTHARVSSLSGVSRVRSHPAYCARRASPNKSTIVLACACISHTHTHIHTQYVNYMKKQWLRILNRG